MKNLHSYGFFFLLYVVLPLLLVFTVFCINIDIEDVWRNLDFSLFRITRTVFPQRFIIITIIVIMNLWYLSSELIFIFYTVRIKLLYITLILISMSNRITI